MSLLSVGKRKKYFEALSLGEYNETNIKKFQRKYFKRAKDIDGIYGPDTDILLRHVYTVRVEVKCKNFTPDEFICDCGKCTGYPTYMRANMLRLIQNVRNKYNKPVYVTSALRCAYENKSVGGVPNSRHLTGQAVDYYINGVTTTLAGRKQLIKFLTSLPKHDYSYCNGADSYNRKRVAPNMGNAVHTQSK